MRRAVRRTPLGFSMLVGVLLLALVGGCFGRPGDGSSPGQTLSSTAPLTDVRPIERDRLSPGGELRIAIPALPSQWNPWHHDQVLAGSRAALDPIMPRFFTADADGAWHANPDFLAGEPEASGNPLVVRLRLNPDAVWADGAPITWEDVRAPLMACNGSTPGFACADTFGPSHVDTVQRGRDDYEAVVTFTGPYPDWREVIVGPGRAELFADPESFDWPMPDLRAQAGPYLVDRYDAASGKVVAIPNNLWWGAEPMLDRLTFRELEPSAQAEAFANNEVDVFSTALDRDATERARAVVDGALRQARGGSRRSVLLNARRGPLTDVAVRQAISRALDREAIRSADLEGLTVSGAVWPTETLGHHLLRPGQPGYHDNSDLLGGSPDLVAAGRQLTEAGWTPGKNGVRHKNGHPLQLNYLQVADVPVADSDATLIRSQLRDLGVEVIVTEVSHAEFGTRVRRGAYQITTATLPRALSAAELVSSQNPSVLTGLDNSEVDAALDQWATTDRSDDRAAVAQRIDELLWRQAVMIPLYQVPQSVATRRSVANLGAAGLSSVDWTLVGLSS